MTIFSSRILPNNRIEAGSLITIDPPKSAVQLYSPISSRFAVVITSVLFVVMVTSSYSSSSSPETDVLSVSSLTTVLGGGIASFIMYRPFS